MEQSLYDACKRKSEGIDDILWQELAEQYKIPSKENPDGDILRKRFGRAKIRDNQISETEELSLEEEEKFRAKESTSYDDTGHIKTIASERVIAMSNEEKKDPEFVLTAHGFDPKEWVVVNLINNFWQSPRPEDKGVRDLYQSKLTVKPRFAKHEISFSDIDKWFNDYKYVPIKNNYEPKGYDENGVVVEINIADIHVGNAEYEKFPMTIEERVDYVIEDVIKRIKNIKVKNFYLVQLGDIAHYDTEGRTTTGGTRLTYNGDSNSTIFDRSINILINAIEKLKVIAPTEVICIYGNHDRIVSYGISKAIEFYYRNDRYIKVDAGHNARKFRKFGNNLVFWQHGDMGKKNLKSIIYKEAREEFGQTKFAEIHCGNYHHEQTLEADGMIIRYLPSLISADEWHQLKGYTNSIMSVCSFVWDLNNGLRDIWYSNIPK